MPLKKDNTHNLTYELYDKHENGITNNETSHIHDILNNDDYFPDDDYISSGFQLPNENANSSVDEMHDDEISAQYVDYFENYTMKLLHHIANYYNIPKNKIKKDKLITLIIDYENNPENSVNVYNRKRYWHYIQELQQDNYFGKFIVFN